MCFPTICYLSTDHIGFTYLILIIFINRLLVAFKVMKNVICSDFRARTERVVWDSVIRSDLLFYPIIYNYSIPIKV